MKVTKRKVYELFPPRIYDSTKENNAFHYFVYKLGLAELLIKELGTIVTKAQTSKYSAIRVHSKTVDAASTEMNIKINYIIRRIDSY